MDIQSHAGNGHEDGQPTYGSLEWFDEAGFRYHINVHVQPDGAWVWNETRRGWSGPTGRWVIKNPPEGTPYRRNDTKYLNGKAHVEKAIYALEQQNAHHLIEDDAADKKHQRELKEANDKAARAARVRMIFKTWLETELNKLQEEGVVTIGAFEALQLADEVKDETFIALDDMIKARHS